MSCERYCATRAREALQASDAAPLAARSWLIRLNSTPAAPPTVETGGRGGLRTGAGGMARWATGAAGAGSAATGVGGTGVGAGAGSSASNGRSLKFAGLACVARTSASAVLGPVVLPVRGWAPRTLKVASVTSGTPTARTILVTDRDM